MTNKELRRLRKTELMELLVDQMKQNEWLQKKLEGQETELQQTGTRPEKSHKQFSEESGQRTEKEERLAEQARLCTERDALLAEKDRLLREMDDRIAELWERVKLIENADV